MADDAYRGFFGAFPYAARASSSWLFRSYVLVGGLLVLLVTLVVGTSVVKLVGETAAVPGGSFTLARALFVLVGVFAVAPLAAPVLLVARRHRRRGSEVGYDRALAAAGYLFALSLYVALVASVPPAQQETPPAAIEPVVDALYALPAPAALVFPLVGAAAVVIAHRLTR